MSKLSRVLANLKITREKAAAAVGQALQVAEVSGTSFGLAYARGRMGEAGELDVAGIPVGLALGIGGHLLGFAGVFGKHGEHVHNVSDGALAEWSAHMGAKMGAEHQAQAAAGTTGRFAVGGYHRPQISGARVAPSHERWGSAVAYQAARGGKGM